MIELTMAPGRPPVASARAAGDGWLADHREELRAVVLDHGAVLVRGLEVRDPGEAASACRQVLPALVDEREPFAPRRRYAHGVYSSSAWPADQPMCMHHECSYALEPPALQVFCCVVAPSRGGATALADAAAVLADLPPPLVERFERTGWELRRTHSDLVGLPYEEAFGTSDRAEVERYCSENDIEWRWGPDGALRTRRRRPAVVDHPVSGRRLWLNQVAFLSEWTMEPAVRAYLLEELGPDGLPFNTAFGDGEPLGREVVDLVNDVYDRHAVREPWHPGDVLIVDNLRMAHSRDPFAGEREIVVAMGDPVRPRTLSMKEGELSSIHEGAGCVKGRSP